MKQHRYHVTVEHLETAKPGGPLHEPLHFESGNHDEILAIVDRLRAGSGFDADTAASLGIGLKLFSEVMLMHRDHPLFAGIFGPMREFIGVLKARGKQPEAPAGVMP
ncbi:MAG: DUF3861 domain-containing protein [Nevskiales bacterium]